MQTFKFVQKSSNAKTGPIPVVYSSRSTCPDSCPMKGAECYAEYGPVRLAWNRAESGISASELSAEIAKLPREGIWRYGVAGDLPGENESVDVQALDLLIRANSARDVIAYSHKKSEQSLSAIRDANQRGFTINISADSVSEADYYYRQDLPTVLTVPSDAPEVTYTASGARVVVCPAQTREDVTCESCRLCSVSNRRVIVGFRAHGTKTKSLDRRIKLQEIA